MNKYLIAALYVMAGCVVAVPLKVQGSSEPLKGERCRLIITNTVKVVSIYLEEKEVDSDSFDLPSCQYDSIETAANVTKVSFGNAVCVKAGLFEYSSYKIRAPEII